MEASSADTNPFFAMMDAGTGGTASSAAITPNDTSDTPTLTGPDAGALPESVDTPLDGSDPAAAVANAVSLEASQGGEVTTGASTNPFSLNLDGVVLTSETSTDGAERGPEVDGVASPLAELALEPALEPESHPPVESVVALEEVAKPTEEADTSAPMNEGVTAAVVDSAVGNGHSLVQGDQDCGDASIVAPSPTAQPAQTTVPYLAQWLSIKAPREVAEAALVKTGTAGAFVVRWGQSAGCRVLTVLSASKKVFHFRIHESNGGVLLRDTTPPYTGPPFASVEQCLAHFHLNGPICPSIPLLTECAQLSKAQPPRPTSGVGSWGTPTSTPAATPIRSNPNEPHNGHNGNGVVHRGGPTGQGASNGRVQPSTPRASEEDAAIANVTTIIVHKDADGKLGMNIVEEHGAIIISVAHPGGAAARHGVQVGWKLLAINGAEPKNLSAARRLIAMNNPITFSFWPRSAQDPVPPGPTATPAVTVGSPPPTPMADAGFDGHFKPPRLSTASASSADSGAFNPVRSITLKKGPDGKLGLCIGKYNGTVVITRVPPGSVVEEAGIKTFWEVLRINGTVCTVDNVKEVPRLIASSASVEILVRPSSRSEIKRTTEIAEQRSVSSSAMPPISNEGEAAEARPAPPSVDSPPPRHSVVSPEEFEAPPDAFLPSMTLFEGVAKMRDGDKRKGKWKTRHLVLDLLGQLNCHRPKGKSGKERGDKIDMVVDIARDGEEIRVGALAHANSVAQWPKKTGSPGCCFSLTTSSDKTWHMVMKTAEMAGALATAMHRFKPQLVVAALPGVLSGEFDKNHFGNGEGTGNDNATDDWENDEDDAEEDRKSMAAIPSIAITTKYGKLSAKDLGARVEIKPPTSQAKHRIFGVLRFCGPDRATNAPLCGVELYEPIGDGSGKFGENEYFRCEPGHALFVEQKRVRLFGNVTIRTKDEWAEIVVAATKKGKSAVSRVVDELKLRVRAEDPFAPMVLGKLYEIGQHVERNNDLATVNYQKASDYGSVDGTYSLAMQFLGQEAGGFAHQFGVRYLEKAVDLNHYPARIALAGCMFTGTGRKGQKDPERAIQLLTEAAVQGISSAQYQLGQCCLYGMGIRADHEAAVRWLKKAEALGLDLAGEALRRIESFSSGEGDL